MAKDGVEELITELGINITSKIIGVVPELAEIVNINIKLSPDNPFQGVPLRLKALDKHRGYTPHFDIAIINRSLFVKSPSINHFSGNYWAHSLDGCALISTNSGGNFKWLVKHEFAHDFGIKYAVPGGNCGINGCLMTIIPSGPKLCSNCEKLALRYIRDLERKYKNNIFNSKGKNRALQVLGIDL